MWALDDLRKKLKQDQQQTQQQQQQTQQDNLTWLSWLRQRLQNPTINPAQTLKESLEGEENPYLFSMDQIKNMVKWDNWFNTDFTKLPWNIWHTITDKDEDKWILDYSEYKHYKSALQNADENTDLDAVYKQMADEWVIDYDKFTKWQKENPESKPVMSKYEQAISDIKTSFDNKLSKALSPYMSGVEWSYQLNAVTKAREEMYDQYEMFINSYAGTYKDTRDDKLLEDFNNILDEYENSIIQFTTQWAKNLTTKNESWLVAYYDTLNDDWMKEYANRISSIQASAENKMTRAALEDSFEWWIEAIKNFNVAWAMWEIVRAALNTVNWWLDKAWNVIEEWKQIAWGWYDVVEELANLNVYSNDAWVLERSFWTMASWAWEILDWVPTWWPAIIDIVFWSKAWITKATKIWEVAKTTKVANKLDEIVASVFKNKRNINLLNKTEEWWILLWAEEWNTRLARFAKELMDDILLFDVSAQQFEWRPISDNDALSNMMFNIPIDNLIAKFSRWARYFSPDIPASLLKSDIISDDMLTILQKGKNWNKWQWKDISVMAEDLYMLASIEKNAPKNNAKMWTKEQISQLDWGKDLVEYINKVQDEATNIWNRLTTFQDVTNRDILLSAQSKISNMKNKTALQALEEATEALATNNKVINALQNQVRLKSLYSYLKSLVFDWRISKENFALVFNNVRIDDKWFKELIKTLLTDWTEQEFRNALAIMQKEWSNNISQSQIYNNFNKVLWELYKENPNIIQAGDIVWWYVKNANWYYYDIFNKSKTYTEEEFFNRILPGLDKATDSINKDAFSNAINKELSENWTNEKDVTNIFEWTPVKNMLDSFWPDQWERTVDWNVEYVWRDNPKIVAINELFNKLWLSLKVEWWIPTIYSTRKALTNINNWLNKLRNFQNLTNMDMNAWATYKLLFANDYANQFDNIIKSVEAIRGAEEEKLTKDFIESAARNWNSPHENLYKKLVEQAKELSEAVEWRSSELKEEFKDSEFGAKLSEDILNSLNGKWTAAQVEATAAEIDIINKTVEATDMDSLEDELMKFFTIEVDASTLNAADKKKRWLGNKNLLWRKVMIGKIPEETARSIVKRARSVVENMSFETQDDKLKAFSVIWKWLATISSCPYTATLLSKQNDTFVNVLLGRILINDEKATYSYMNYMEKKINKWLELLDIYKSKNHNIFEYNKWVMEMRNWVTQMQNRIEAIKNYYEAGKAWIDMSWVKEQIIANINKLNDEFFNREDFEAGKKVTEKLEGRILKRFASWKEATLSSLNDTDISYISDYLARNQLDKSGLYSYKLYQNLKKWFEKWLIKAKELFPDSTFKVDKDWEFKNIFENNTSVFWIFDTARVLWNFDNEDLWATAIIHEIMHQDNIAWLKQYTQLHWNVWDLAERGRLLAEDEYLTKNMWGSFLNYVQSLKEKLKQSVITANKNGEFKNNNSFLYAYTNEYSRKEILDWIEERFGKENLVNSLVEKWNNFMLWEDGYRIHLWNIIDDEYVTALEEIITEYRTMVALWDAWYKYANAPYVLQALDTLEKAADVIDRFRVLCVEDNRLTHRTEEWVRKILSATFNNIDLRVNETFTSKLTDTFNKWIVNDSKDWLSEWSARKYVKKLQSAFKIKYMPTSVEWNDAKQWALNALNEYKWEDLNVKEVKEFIEQLDWEETIQFLDAIDCIDMSVRDYNYEIVKRLSQKPVSEFERFETSRPQTWVERWIDHQEITDSTWVYTDTEKELFKLWIFTREDFLNYKSKFKDSWDFLADAAKNNNLEELWEDMESTMYISNMLLKNSTKENVWVKATINWMAQSLWWLDSWYIEILNSIFKNTRESIDSKKLLVWNKTLKAFWDSKTNQDLSTFITNKIVANLLDKKWIYNQEIIDTMNNIMFIDNVNKAIADLSWWKWYNKQSNPVAIKSLIDILSEEYWLTDSIDIISKLTPWDINRFNSNVQAYLTSFINSYSNEEIWESALDTFGKKIANEFVKLVRMAEWVDNKRSYYLAFNNLLFWDELWRKILDDDTSEYLKNLLTKPVQKNVNWKIVELEPYWELTEFVGWWQFTEAEEPFVKQWLQIRSNLETDEIIDAILPQIRKDKEKYKTTKWKTANRKYEQLQLLEDELLKERNRPRSKAFWEWTSSKLTTKNDKFTKQQSLSLKQYNDDAKPYIDKINEVKWKLTKLEDEYNTLKNEEKWKWIEEERKRIRKALNNAEWIERTRLQKEWFNLENTTPHYWEWVKEKLEKMWNDIESLRFELDLQENKLDDINVHYQWVIDYRDLKWTEVEKGFYGKEWDYVQWDAIELLSEDSMLNWIVENDIWPKFIDRIIDKYKMKYSPIYNIVEDWIWNEAKAMRINYAVFYNQISNNKWIGKKIDDAISNLLERNKEYEKAWVPSNKIINEWQKRRYVQNIKDWLYVWWTTVDTANVRWIDKVIWTKIGWDTIDKCIIVFSDGNSMVITKEWDKLRKEFTWWISKYKLAESIINSTARDNSAWVIVRFARNDWKILEQKQLSKTKVWSSFVWQEVSKELWIYNKIQRDLSRMTAKEYWDTLGIQNDWQWVMSISKYIDAIKQVWVKKVSLWWTAVEEVLYQDVLVAEREKIKEEITYLNMLLDDKEAKTTMSKEQMKDKIYLLEKNLWIVNNIMDSIKKDLPDSSWVKEEYESFKNKAKTFTIEDVDKYFDENWNLWKAEPGKYEKTYVKYKKVWINEDWQIVPIKDASGNDSVQLIERKYNEWWIERVRENTIFYYRVDKEWNPKELIRSEPWTNKRTVIWWRPSFDVISEDMWEKYIKEQWVYTKKIYQLDTSNSEILEDLRLRWEVQWRWGDYEFTRPELDMDSWELRLVMKNDLTWEEIEWILRDVPAINQMYWTTYRLKEFTPVDKEIKFGNLQLNNALDKWKLNIKDEDIIDSGSSYFNYSKWEWRQYPGISKYYINPNTNRLISKWSEWEDMFEYAQWWFPFEWSTWSDVEKTINAAKNTRKGTLLDKDIVFRYENETDWIWDRWLQWKSMSKKANTNKDQTIKAADKWIVSEWAAKKAVDAAKDIENMLKQSKQIEDEAANYAQNSFDWKEAINRLFALTNYDILGNSEYLQHIRWTRDVFISKNKAELESIVNKWDTIVWWLSQDEKNNIMNWIKEKLDWAIKNAKWERIIEKPIKEPVNNAEELINQFIWVFAREWNKWYTDWIMRMINNADSLEDIMYKLYFSDAISMIWLNADVHNISEARDTIYNWVRNMVKTDREAMQIAKDFVWDPLWWGNTYKLMSNIRSAARFAKYSILSPISWTIMFMNSALLSEPLLAGKKKIVASYLNNKTFNKILENEDLLSFMSRDWSIVENGNTDMQLKWIWMDNQLKKFANFISNPNSKTKLWQQWNKVVNTVMLWWWHSLYDLWRQWEVKKVAFAQALSEMWIPESALPDLLAKINDWRIYSDPGLSRTWAQIMAKTEEFYARFFSNAGTQALSRHRFSRLWWFNFLQWYVVNRTDEMLQWFRQLQKFINDAWIGNLTWNDVTRHLAKDNQELLSFMNNILASVKMWYYYEKISDNDSKRDNNLIWYFVSSNDYLSSLDATWFFRLLISPYESIKAYNQYSEWAWEEATIWWWVKVATIKLFSDICSQFFREGKFLNAIRDTLVAYWQTWDLDFAATVAWVEWDKMANSLWRFGLVEWQEKYWLEDFSQKSDIIWQMLLATDKATKWWKEQQDMYNITNVDNIINSEWWYTAMNVLWKLPLIWELLKSATGKWWFTFSEAKYKELMDLVDNDKWMQELYKWELNTEVFSDEAINRIWSDFTAFNYPAKSLKTIWKHSVWSYIEGKDTTLNSMREDVFVQNICEKMWIDIEEFHNMIVSDSAKTTWRLKVMAAAEAAEPGSWKIVLSYIMANDLYKLEQEYTNKQYPSNADIPDDVMIMLKKMVLEKDGNQMFTADKASWYKTIMEYVSEVKPEVFKELYKNNTLTNYVNSVWFMDMLMWDAAQKWDVNAAYVKNVFWVINKYMKNDDARIKATEHIFNTIEELDAPQSVKNMAMQWTLAGNIDFYNKLKNSPVLSTIYKDALDNFEHWIWWTLDTEIPVDNMYNKSYKKYTPYSSEYWDKNKKVNDDLTDKAYKYFPKSSWNWTRAWNLNPYPYTTGSSVKPKDALDWYRKYYEGLIKDYSDKLVKSEGKKYPAQTIEWMTFKTWSNNRWSIKWQKLSFPKHKSKKYRTNVLSNLPGSHW